MMPATQLASIHSRLASTDPEVRRIAVMDLLDSDEDDVDQYLLDALKDADAKVRAEAARLLEGYETHEVVEGLIGVLDDDSAEVREAAAVSLSELKDAAMGDGLLAALPAASQAFMQAALFRALRELRRPEAFTPALAALGSSDVGVRCTALGVLGYLKNPAALPDIARIAGSDAEVEARRIAVGALGFATDPAAVVPAMKRR
jgi:HEAT repeat protein